MNAPPRFEICHAQTFPLELGRAPKKVQNAYQRIVIPALQDSPNQTDPPRIKPLKGYKNLWRLRVSDDYSDLTDFLNQRDGEIIAFARPDLAVSGTGLSSAALGVDIRAMSARHIQTATMTRAA